MSPRFMIRYDRRVSEAFLQLFLAGGPLNRLQVIAHQAAMPLDLQMRRSAKSGAQWASLYVGLTSVLDVHAVGTNLRFKAHDTWSGKGRHGFSPGWGTAMSAAEAADAWPEIELYLERVIPVAAREHAMAEGVVQSVTSKQKSTDWAILDREVLPHFVDRPYKDTVLRECMRPLLEVTAEAAAKLTKFPAGPSRFGTECDLLALDKHGRLLAIEVKPLGAGTIAWVAAQATMYARILQAWVDTDLRTATDGVTPHQVIADTLAQRQALGHCPGFSAAPADVLEVVPVVVLQRGTSAAKRDQMLQVCDLLAKRLPDRPAVEIYEVSILGDFTRIP